MPYKKSALYGGQGGSDFSDDLTQTARIVSISIRHGSRVDSIQTTWLLTDGSQLIGKLHGGSGGKEDVIQFAADEHVVTIQGRSGSRVDSLTITTNKKSYGPYGGDGGESFGPIPAERAGGFFGRSGSELDAIGVFIPAE
ncbi:Jacalin-like lectin domain-containing protein [Giesbergeria anulus]|uniref:Jacalin-like lectin domain-containing protein n=2 Tax=Giesbergeria anulus TaxID=180197 RepID=A0A1H9QGB2_9BURK|nr:Jacalin-like lectin domain-containing protein [Giesbergeria anulus]